MDTPLRILQVVTRNEMRGAEVFAAQLSEHLIARGHEVHQAGLYRLSNPADRLQSASLPMVELGGKRKGRIELRVLATLKRHLREFKPHVLQANGFHALKFIALFKRLWGGCEPVIYRNISLASHWNRNSITRLWGAWLCRCIDYVCSVSEVTADDFARLYKCPADRVVVVRRGIEVPTEGDYSALQATLHGEFSIPPQARVLSHIGGFTAEKNHIGLLEAYRQIRSEAGCEVHLVLFGDGPLRGEIECRVKYHALQNHVHFAGYRNNARQLVGGSDVLLLTSHVEGVPGVVMEAGAYRVPSVAVDVGGVAELVSHEATGMLAPPGDMHAVAQYTLRLLSDDTLRRSLGSAIRERVVQEYSMQRTVEEFEKVYRQAISKRAKR